MPRLLVPDNAKVAVIKACLYEPQVNRTYAEMAAHYGTAVLPTRPHRPRDKAKVEAAVLVIERWILARLRNQRFYSLAELNAAIGALLKRLDDERPIRRLGVTRRQLLEELDRPALTCRTISSHCARLRPGGLLPGRAEPSCCLCYIMLIGTRGGALEIAKCRKEL